MAEIASDVEAQQPEGNDWISQPPINPPPPDRVVADALKAEAITGTRVPVETKELKASTGREVIDLTTESAEGIMAIRVQVGPETFTPIKFQTFVVGPVVIEALPRKGESVGDCYVRLRNMAESMFATELKLMTTRHFQDVETVAHYARRHTPSE